LLERTEQPEVCHLKPEVERLGLVPKSPIWEFSLNPKPPHKVAFFFTPKILIIANLP
jgi:hypothetical protein